MAIAIPSIPSLNVRGLDWLIAEEVLWSAKIKTLSGVDRIKAQEYLDAVRAEKLQREQQYSGGFWSNVWAGVTAPFEALGGSSGPGASGLSTSVSSTAADALDIAGKGFNKILITVAVIVIVLGGVWLFVTKKNG